MEGHPRITLAITFTIAVATLIATVLLATFGTKQASISLLPPQDTEAPRLHPSEATKAWALDAIHRRTTEDTRLRLTAPVMKAD